MSASNLFSELALAFRRTISPIRKPHKRPSIDELQPESANETPTTKNAEANQDEDKVASNQIHKCIPKVYPADSNAGKAEGISQTSGALSETLFQHQIRQYITPISGAQDTNEKVY